MHVVHSLHRARVRVCGMRARARVCVHGHTDHRHLSKPFPSQSRVLRQQAAMRTTIGSNRVAMNLQLIDHITRHQVLARVNSSAQVSALTQLHAQVDAVSV